MSKDYLKELEKLLSFAFVMSENMIGLTKGNYNEDTFIKKTYAYLHEYNVDLNSKLQLKEALQRLEQIDNAEPSEALKYLEHIKKDNFNMIIATYPPLPAYNGVTKDEMFNKIEQTLIKAQEQEKVIKVIFEKGFDEDIKDYDDYNIWVEYKVEQFAKAINDNPTILNWDMFDKFTYTKEEFDTLKRWVECQKN